MLRKSPLCQLALYLAVFNPAATLARFIRRAMTALSSSFSPCFPPLFCILSMLDKGEKCKSQRVPTPDGLFISFFLLFSRIGRNERGLKHHPADGKSIRRSNISARIGSSDVVSRVREKLEGTKIPT